MASPDLQCNSSSGLTTSERIRLSHSSPLDPRGKTEDGFLVFRARFTSPLLARAQRKGPCIISSRPANTQRTSLGSTRALLPITILVERGPLFPSFHAWDLLAHSFDLRSSSILLLFRVLTLLSIRDSSIISLILLFFTHLRSFVATNKRPARLLACILHTSPTKHSINRVFSSIRMTDLTAYRLRLPRPTLICTSSTSHITALRSR